VHAELAARLHRAGVHRLPELVRRALRDDGDDAAMRGGLAVTGRRFALFARGQGEQRQADDRERGRANRHADSLEGAATPRAEGVYNTRERSRKGRVMSSRVALFWPGDARAKPNELALPNVEEATQGLERAFAKLGRTTYRVPGFLTKPHEAIERLGPIDDPLVGVSVHWFYGPHTPEGVLG